MRLCWHVCPGCASGPDHNPGPGRGVPERGAVSAWGQDRALGPVTGRCRWLHARCWQHGHWWQHCCWWVSHQDIRPRAVLHSPLPAATPLHALSTTTHTHTTMHSGACLACMDSRGGPRGRGPGAGDSRYTHTHTQATHSRKAAVRIRPAELSSAEQSQAPNLQSSPRAPVFSLIY